MTPHLLVKNFQLMSVLKMRQNSIYFSLIIDYNPSAVTEITDITCGDLLSSFQSFFADTSNSGRIEVFASNSYSEMNTTNQEKKERLFTIQGFLISSSPFIVSNSTGDLEGTNSTIGIAQICIPEYAFLIRSVPDSVAAGESFEVKFSIGGGPASIRKATETIPSPFEVADSNGGTVTGNIIHWNSRPSSYTLIAPETISSGTYTFEGTQTSYHSCIGSFTSGIRGQNIITVQQLDTPPTAVYDFDKY